MIEPKSDKGDSLPAAKRLVRARSGSVCERCGIRGDVEFHHRMYRSRGGLHVPENGVDLCGWGNTTGCHGWAHGDRDARLLGYAIPGWVKDVSRVPIHRILPLTKQPGWALQIADRVDPITTNHAAELMRELGIWRAGERA